MSVHISLSAMAALVSLCALCGCSSFFPPEVQDENSVNSIYGDLGERPLWSKEAARGYTRRVRVFIYPSYAFSRIAIRIDTKASGETTGYFTLVRPSHNERQPEIRERRTFTVTASDLATFNQLIDESMLWRIYPQHWVSSEAQISSGTVCIDGVQLIMERVTDLGYRYSEGNAICPGVPLRALQLVDHMIDMAGLGKSEVHYWIRNYLPAPGEEEFPPDVISERPGQPEARIPAMEGTVR